MDTALWQQIREVFHTAVELPAGERERYLDQACSDAAMRREVESLLKSHQDAGDLLEVPALKLSEMPKSYADDPWIGNSIGQYQVIAKIGQGGMGTVYRAMRVDDHYFKQVAIKVVRTGLADDHHVRRFKNERQIMASLDHPNIARLLDGGTAKGAPYFVMEYIEGKRIDDYCDSLKLSTHARIKLFLEVCAAVQYAHQNLIVHRDLKPSNILITAQGVPKLLDFGIAKLLEPEMFLQTAELTMSQMKPMTPEFASPEQILGEPITTVSDVYSLGVLLYRLLTGHSPYKIEGQPLHALARAISETEPIRPSLVIDRTSEETGIDGKPITLTPESVSRTRDGQPDALKHRLSGDLDNILLKALRKEPVRRYMSVEQFADDLRRHLDGLPVLARKDTIRYRTVKFVKRHTIGVAATVIVALSLIGGIVTSAWQAHIARVEKAKAEQRFNDVRHLANTLIFDMDDAIANLPGSTPARKILVDNAAQYLDSLAKESSGDLSLQRELASAYAKLADVQGNQFRGNLGETAAALESYRKVSTMREALVAANSDNVDDQLALAESYRKLSQMLVLTGDLQGGMQYAARSLPIMLAVANVRPNDLDVLDRLEDAYEVLGDIQGGNGLSANLGDTEAALENHRRALEIAEGALKIKPDDPKLRRAVALYKLKVAFDLTEQGNRAGALANSRDALEIYKSISEGGTNALYSRELNVVYSRIADLHLVEGDSKEAYKNYKAALVLAQQLAAADPISALANDDVATTYAGLAIAAAGMGNRKEALDWLQKSIAMVEQESRSDPEHTEHKRVLGMLYIWKAEILAASGNLDSALSEYRKTADIFSGFVSKEPKDIQARVVLAATRVKIGDVLTLKNNLAAASETYQQAISGAESLALSAPANHQAQYALADAYSGMGDVSLKQAVDKSLRVAKRTDSYKRACSWFEKSWAVWKQVHNPGRLSPGGFATAGPSLVADKLKNCDVALQQLETSISE